MLTLGFDTCTPLEVLSAKEKPGEDEPSCDGSAHQVPHSRASDVAIDKAARLFRALAHESRLRTLELLVQQEACVSELAQATGESLSTVSHRLRLLRAEDLVVRRRDGRHIYYSLADGHVIEMIRNALDHASEAHPPIS